MNNLYIHKNQTRTNAKCKKKYFIRINLVTRTNVYMHIKIKIN